MKTIMLTILLLSSSAHSKSKTYYQIIPAEVDPKSFMTIFCAHKGFKEIKRSEEVESTSLYFQCPNEELSKGKSK